MKLYSSEAEFLENTFCVEPVIKMEKERHQQSEDNQQVCVYNSYDTSSPASSLTLEDLDNLMLVDDTDDPCTGASNTIASTHMMQELEQLILENNNNTTDSQVFQHDSPVQCPSTIDSWSSGMMIIDEEEENGEEATSSSSNSHRAPEMNSGSTSTSREMISSSSPTSSASPLRTNLIDMLQECIASHLDKKSKKQDSPPPIFNPRAVSRDIMTLLHDCAHAVAARDAANASSLAALIRRQHGAAPNASDARYRAAHYFVESLMARLLGTGTGLTAASDHAGGPDVMERVYDFRLRSTPSPLIPHFFSTRSILAASRGCSCLHIVELGLARNRFQWALLLQALANRSPVLKRLRITAIDSQQHAALLQQLGERIYEQATRLGISTEIEIGIGEPGSWEGILSQVPRESGKNSVLVVNSLFALDSLVDETAVQARSPRRAVLTALHRLQPDLVVMGVNDARRAVPDFSFLERFSQAVERFSAKFDAARECVMGNEDGRLAYEGKFLGPEILNLIACDGVDRVVRTAPFEEWHRAMVGAGFEVIPVEQGMLNKGRTMMTGYNRSFEMDQADGWVKLSWKKVTTQCVSAWRLRTPVRR